MDKLNILVLHRMGDPKYWRAAVRELEFMLPTYASGHNYIVHAADMPLPGFIKDIDFHGIVLGPTFLCNRYNPENFAKVLKDYDFIRDSNALKIAMPQDDYDCSAILDQWMVSWNIDLVYTVCPDHWGLLYPKYLNSQGAIKLGYTGYISDQMIEHWQTPKPFDEREIDVSYRSHTSDQFYGKYGFMKACIGDRFKSKVNDLGFALDISTKSSDMIPGIKWHDFVENSRFCLATNSGSSLLDPVGETKKKINCFLARFPRATFKEVEQHCYPGEDGKYIFTAISPRNIEAALAETVQIATPGDYNGIFIPEQHYIPLEPDCSNISDVVLMMKDRPKTADIAKKCKESILAIDALRFNNHVYDLIHHIQERVSAKRIKGSNERAMGEFARRYHDEVTIKVKLFWQKYRTIKGVKRLVLLVGARKLKKLIQG